MTDDLNQLAGEWLVFKRAEADAITGRRKIEDRIKSLVGVSENLEGTETVAPEGYTIKIVGRIDRKVDSEKLQELAAEYGLTEHLTSLFRWSANLNILQWNAAHQDIQKALSGAITAKPGRPSFSIVKKE